MPTKIDAVQTSPWARSGGFWTLEVKSAIFNELYLDSNRSEHHIFSRSHPSVVISQVCKDWRDAALIQAPLWTDLKLVLPNCADFKSNKAYVSQVRTLEESLISWLRRSKALSLKVTLGNVNREAVASTTTGKGGQKRLIAFDHLWATLSSSSSRWVRLRFVGGAEHGQWVRDALHAQRMRPEPSLALTPLTNITTLEVGGKTSTQSLLFGMDAQTCLTMQKLVLNETQTENLDVVLKLLVRCPNLVNLVIQRSLEHWGPYTCAGGGRVTLPKLESLTFKESPPVPGFDNALILPSIRHFTFCDMTEKRLSVFQKARLFRFATESEASLRKWMEGLGPSLETLSLVNNSTYPRADWMLKCFKDNLLCNLTELTLLGRCDTDLLFDKWLATGSCPNLERLICVPSCYDDALVTERSALNFLRNRLGGAGKAKSKVTYARIGVRAEKRPSDVKNILGMGRGVLDALKGVVVELVYIPPRQVTLVLDGGRMSLAY